MTLVIRKSMIQASKKIKEKNGAGVKNEIAASVREKKKQKPN